jgi:hypothetical protein
LSRGTAMLAVAAQLPAAVLADEASGATAIATIAQITDAALFVFTMRPPLLASMNEASIRTKDSARLTGPLNHRYIAGELAARPDGRPKNRFLRTAPA